MKDFDRFDVILLSKKEASLISGGATFAYRVGQLVRYLALGGGTYAYYDLLAHEAVNSN